MSSNYYYDPDSGSFHRSTPPKKNDDSWFGWGLIAFMFIVGAWPIGLILLISKLSDSSSSARRAAPRPTAQNSTFNNASSAQAARPAAAQRAARAAKSVTKTPKDTAKNAKALQIIGAAIMAIFGIAAVSTVGEGIGYGFYSYMVQELFTLVGFFAGGATMFFAGRKMHSRQKRIQRYKAIIGSRDYISIGELMAIVNQNYKTVEKDIEHMIDKGMLGKGAFIDSGRGVLFISADAYQRFLTERTKKENLTPKEANEGYAGALRAIRAANDRIPDPVFSEKLDRMELLAGKIFREVEAHPEKQKQAATFFDYYLPTTLKLLATYTEFEEAGIEGENLRQAKERIESIMDTLLANFERQLDELYRSEALDVDADIRVMENMLTRDLSSVEQDFGLGTAAVQQPEDME